VHYLFLLVSLVLSFSMIYFLSLLAPLSLWLLKRYINPLFSLVFLIVFYSIFFGFRADYIGTDTINYIEIYNSHHDFKDPVFDAFLKVMQFFDVSSMLFIMFFSLTFYIIYFVSLYRFAPSLFPLVAIFAVTSYTFYSFSLNIMRQGVAVSLCMVALYFFYKRKYFISLLLILMASGIHSSSLILLPVLGLLYLIRYYKFVYIFMAGLVFYISMIFFPFKDFILFFVSYLPSDLRFVFTFLRHVEHFSVGNEGPWIRFTSFLVFFISFIYLFLDKWFPLNNPKLDILIRYYFVGFVLLSPFIYMHLLYYRLSWYFTVIEPLIIAMLIVGYVFNRVPSKEQRILLSFLIVVIALIYFLKTYFYTGGIINENPYASSLL